MRLRHVYLILCVIGLLLPYTQLIPWFLQHGLNLSLFFHELFVNRISSFFGFDVIVWAAVLWIFISAEGARIHMGHLWLPLLSILIVGVSLGLPLFLYMRQLRIDARKN